MKLFLQSASNNQYVCADDNLMAGTRVLAANRPSPGLWETFYAMGVEFTDDELRALAEALRPYLGTPTTPPGPEPPTNDPSQVPFHVYATGSYDLATKAGCCSFTEECARQLHVIDSDWGHVKKNPGQEQCEGTQPYGHAVDAVWNKRTGDARDIIVSSGVPGAAPAWNKTGTPPPEAWFAPV